MFPKIAALVGSQSTANPFVLEPWNAKRKEVKTRKSTTGNKTIVRNESPRESQSAKLPIPLTSKPLPKLPANAFFPKYDTKDFDFALDNAVHDLRKDTTSSAHHLADAALTRLGHFAQMAATIAITRVEFWTLMVRAAKKLSAARPSMSAAVTACLLRALDRIVDRWTEEQVDHPEETTALADITVEVIGDIFKERQETVTRLAETFTLWLKKHCGANVRIITLSNSSTIRSALLHALAALPDVTFRLTMAASQLRCEGADFAAQLYAAVSDHNRLHITITPDRAVGEAIKDVDLVLLGADRITSTGDVCNKMGSIPAAICANIRRKKTSVVVLSDADKIAAPASKKGPPEQHPAHRLRWASASDTTDHSEGKENVEVFGECFECVSAKLVDVYVTELGVLDVDCVGRLANEVKDLKESIFGSSQERARR